MKEIKKQSCREWNRLFSVVSVLLGVAAIATTAAYFLHKLASERAYHNKWKEYDECGIM